MGEYQKVALDEDFLCFWGDHLTKDNEKFINQIDSEYYFNMAEILSESVVSENKTSVMLLRQQYLQALESHFAILFTSIQSPNYIIGWLNNYYPKHIRNCILKISRNEKILSPLHPDIINWEKISEYVFNCYEKKNIANLFTSFWKKLAKEYLEQNTIDEYNSLKHGNRVIPGGIHLAIGLETVPGQMAPKEKMQSLGGSEFGSSFYKMNKIDRFNYIISHQTNNWNPIRMLERLSIISLSINNIIANCKILNGAKPGTVKFLNPEDIDLFRRSFDNSIGILNFSKKTSFSEKDIQNQLLKKNDISKSYLKDEK